MSDITPETLVAATPPTVELVAGLLTDADNDFHDGYFWKLRMSASGNVVSVGVEPYADDGGDGDDDEATLLPEVHFRAVVVEGDETPIVLEWPEELGMQWDDGADLLSLTPDGILFNPRGIDEWDLDADGALELAAQLAAMAYASKLLAAREAEQNGGGS